MPLTICLIGKYFPIQGGVSKDNVWLSYHLAKAGFHVHVVTNAEEVEPQYRSLPWSSPPSLPPGCSGSITVHATQHKERRHYIPYANPFVSKLASIATEVVRTYHCDLIYSYYLEPYAVAASLVSRWTGVPYGIRHAGSDVGTLLQSSELQTTYQEVLRGADYIAATPSTFRSFLHMGIPLERLYFPVGSCLPSDIFTPGVPPLDMDAFLTWVQENLPTSGYYDVFRRFLGKTFDPNIPTIGIYGKAGTVKGTFDLVQALALLQKQKAPFQFLALNQGSEATLAAFASSIEEHNLSEVTWLLPFIPHWSVPQFIRSCLAICFLERDFPIPIHTPLIPQEVFACGTCQILSHEIAQKQTYHTHLEHGRNVYLVDPHDHKELAAVLNTIVSHPETSRQIGRQGYDDIGQVRGQFAAEEDAWGNLFTHIHRDVEQRRHMMSIAEMQSYLAQLYTDDTLRRLFSLNPDISFEGYLLNEEEKRSLRAIDGKLLEYFATSLKMKQLEHLRAIYPATFTLPRSLMERLFDRFYHHFPAKPHEETLMRIDQFGVFFEQALAIDELAPCYASDIVRYERLRYVYTYQPTPEDAFSAINVPSTLEGSSLNINAPLFLLPGVYRETFSYPVVDLVDALVKQQPVDEHLIQPGQYHLVFQRERHSLTMNVFTLNGETSFLLDICQQEMTVADLIREAEQQLGEAELADDVLAILTLLQEKHIVGACQ